MLDNRIFNLFIAFITELDRREKGENILTLFEKRIPTDGDRERFYEGLRVILSGYLIADADTQEAMFVSGLSYGLINAEMLETIINDSRNKSKNTNSPLVETAMQSPAEKRK